MRDISKERALRFVILMGVVSLFADMTYEGARSITGPYLGSLGASAAVVGFVAGFGEFLGYGLRLISGYLSDRTNRYWPITFIGYIINLLSVPLLALVGNWWHAGFLIVAERAGKGIRTPARDAMLSHAAQRMGMGWGFGIHEAMDQTGAMLGPLLVALVLYANSYYSFCFAVLTLPALIALISLLISRYQYPDPRALEEQVKGMEFPGIKKSKPFWIYLAGASLVAFGYADFALVAYHFGQIKLFSPIWIPITYAIALGINIIMAPFLGYLYDRKGFLVLIVITFIASFFPPLVFLGHNPVEAFIGVILWGMGLGAQGSLMRAIVGNMVPREKRGSGYGIFNSVFGLFWFIGSTAMGFLYDISIVALVIFSMAAQLLSLPVLWQAKHLLRPKIRPM